MKKVLYIISILTVGLYFIYGLVLTITKINERTTADVVVMLIVLIFVALLEVFLFKKYKKAFDPVVLEEEKRKAGATKREKYDVESKVLGSKARQLLLDADMSIKVKHLAGLPLAEGAEVYLYRAKEKVIFERSQDTYELDIKKVRDILLKTDVEIQKSYVSSVGGAVGGYALFGPLGAMVGGRAKQKESKIEEKYLIFSYDKDGVTDYISFDVTSEPKASFFNNHYYELNSQERRTQSL